MITILVQSSDGSVLASSEHPDEALVCVDRVYQPGDVIRIAGASHLRVQMDQSLPAGEVFLPEQRMTWSGACRLPEPCLQSGGSAGRN